MRIRRDSHAGAGRRLPLSYSNVVATIALFVALGGSAWAIKANSVGSKQIKENAVKAKHIKKGQVKTKQLSKQAVKTGKLANKAVTAKKIADGVLPELTIADGSITGAKIADGTLSDRHMSDYELIGDSFVRVPATEGVDAATARAAAPEVELFSKGQARIYAKCYRDTTADTTFARAYAQTSANGAIMEGTDDHPGGPAATDFLNTDTAEEDRELFAETATGNGASYNESEWILAFPDGTALTGQDGTAAKNGDFAGGNGVYGAGNACLFQGSILG